MVASSYFSISSHFTIFNNGDVAQLAEHAAVNRGVVGSSLSFPAKRLSIKTFPNKIILGPVVLPKYGPPRF